MVRRPNIKWRQNDAKEIARAVKNFNAKRTRLLKKQPELIEFLPEKASVKEIRSNIKTRQDLRNEVNSLQRFTRKGAETPITTVLGIKTTKYEIKETSIKVRVINARRARELKIAAPSTTKGTMGTIRENELRPKKFDINTIRPEYWKRYQQGVKKQARSDYMKNKHETYKENYIKSLEVHLGAYGNSIISLVQGIDASLLVQAYYDDPMLQIDYLYSMKEQEEKAQQILDHFEFYLQNEADRGL